MMAMMMMMLMMTMLLVMVLQVYPTRARNYGSPCQNHNMALNVTLPPSKSHAKPEPKH